MKPRNVPAAYKSNGISFQAERSSLLPCTFLGVSERVRRIKTGTSNMARVINAITRVAQPKPIRGCNCWNTTGKMRPPKQSDQRCDGHPLDGTSRMSPFARQKMNDIPRLTPEAAIPIANALFFAKYVGRTATPGMNIVPLPKPTTRPCARSTSQYREDILVMKVPKTTKKEPVQTSVLK